MKQKIIKFQNKIKFATTTAVLFLLTMPLDLIAQQVDRTGRLRTALTQTTGVISGIIDGVIILIYVVCAIVGVINIVKLYQAINAGENDAQKKAGAWFGAAIVVVLAVYFLRAVLIN